MSGTTVVLEKTEEASVDEAKICPNCGTELPPGANIVEDGKRPPHCDACAPEID